jgi:hypothetical protein
MWFLLKAIHSGDRSMIRGKTLYFASIALIADVVSAQSHTQHRNPTAIGA